MTTRRPSDPEAGEYRRSDPPAPVPEGMETTEPQRDKWKWDRLSQPFQTCVGPLIRDLDRALAEIARLTAINADLCAVNLRHAEESARIAELEAETSRLKAENHFAGSLTLANQNRIAELEAERDTLARQLEIARGSHDDLVKALKDSMAERDRLLGEVAELKRNGH